MMPSEDMDRGALATVEVVYPDGRTRNLSLDFPSVFDKTEWLGINVCECGAGIHYDWDETRTRRRAVCPACGIVFLVREVRR